MDVIEDNEWKRQLFAVMESPADFGIVLPSGETMQAFILFPPLFHPKYLMFQVFLQYLSRVKGGVCGCVGAK